MSARGARDTQRKRRLEIAAIREDARETAGSHREDSFFIGGVTLYWAEGSKSTRRLEMANSDPRLLTFFIEWVRRYCSASADFVLSLNIHADNDLAGAQRFWSDALPLQQPRFTKAFVKPDGTGHRKNHLSHGVCRVTVRRSTDDWIRTMAWIDQLARGEWFYRTATLWSPGR